jgi:DNA-binding PadR family transcriptional regulator
MGRRHRDWGGGGWGFGHRHRRDAFGPFGARGRFFGPGEVRIALLSLLADTPRHGYELMKELEARSGGVYQASAGTVYPTLQQLEDEGLVASGERDGKRVYRLSAAGRRELEAQAESVAKIWRRAEAWGGWRHAASPDAWVLVRPAMELLKSAARAAAAGDADPRRLEKLRAILERAAREIEALADDD